VNTLNVSPKADGYVLATGGDDQSVCAFSVGTNGPDVSISKVSKTAIVT
jgi:hypothetical protein